MLLSMAAALSYIPKNSAQSFFHNLLSVFLRRDLLIRFSDSLAVKIGSKEKISTEVSSLL